ncbi:4946_t:CDS:2 [Paraglomus brasilianum]|uniref:4946_t:CDS:1 n=1 Tax=Paraglomus brasilianum TaxID=144538 RepID=A0A9N9GGR2_9GLOM|nr:4946_t:CDS:2 [Paraglomus brasilianum]
MSSGYGHGSYRQSYGSSPGEHSIGSGWMSESPINSHSPTGSAGSTSQGSSKQYVRQSVRPVTIAQLLSVAYDTTDSIMKIDGQEVSVVTFVAWIRSSNELTTDTNYIMDDGTGCIDVRYWLQNDKPEEVSKPNISKETYARVFGQIKNFGEKRQVISFCVRPVTDFNEITQHTLEVIEAHLHAKHGHLVSDGFIIITFPLFLLFTVLLSVDGHMGGYSYNKDEVSDRRNNDLFKKPLHREIHDIVKQIQSKNVMDDGVGVNKKEIIEKLKNSHGANAVDNGIQWLISEGLLYATIDDDHVKLTTES